MNEAPARISMIMPVMRVVPITLAQKAWSESEPDHQAIPNEPSTPQAAHSVAVAHPDSKVAKTRMIRSAHGIRFADSRSFWPRLIGGSGGGCFPGFSSDQIAM